MIKVYLGNLGAGKTICAVREIVEDRSGRKTYTNIALKGVPNVHIIKPSEVIKKVTDEKGKTKFELNIDFWAKQKKPLNVVWDEVHLSAGNSRQSSSKPNIILSRFIAMARRITGFDERGYGHLIFIAQAERTIDVNIRELTSEIKYMIGHWNVMCRDCHSGIHKTSEELQTESCFVCGSNRIFISDQETEILTFTSWEQYFRYRLKADGWRHAHAERIFVRDTKRYFKYYDTMQISNMWDDYVHSE